LLLSGNISSAAWTTAGIGLKTTAATYTDTTSLAGTIAAIVAHCLNTPTLAATNVITVTDAATLRISAGPANGANVTVTNPYAMWLDSSSGHLRADGSVLIGDAGGTIGSGAAAAQLAVLGHTAGAILLLGRNDPSVTAADLLGEIDFWSNDTSTNAARRIGAKIEATAVGTITSDTNNTQVKIHAMGTGTTMYEVINFSAIGAAAIGFFGTAPAVRPAAYTQTYNTASRTVPNATATNAPAGGTGATAGAYDTAANRDAMITSLNNQIADLASLKKVVNQLIDDFQLLGLLQ
jgi:hypothetical protein